MTAQGPKRRRFHAAVGPEVLFERCRYVVKTRLEPITLGTSIAHYLERAAERQPPAELVAPFTSREWELFTIEALESTGRWISAGWRRRIGRDIWVLIFGKDSNLVTVYNAGRRWVPLAEFKNTKDIVQPSDPFYGKVEAENARLMRDDA